MKLLIDGICVVPQPGESLLDIIRRMGLDSDRLSERPLAAQIAGEVFNLNYIPVRERDITEERVSIRRAMAASKGEIRLLRYDDPAGKDVYTRTAQYIMFLALQVLQFPFAFPVSESTLPWRRVPLSPPSTTW